MKRVFKVIYGRLPSSLRYKVRTVVYPPSHRSRYANAFHCTTQRAGSQWICRVLSDKHVYTYSGLLSFSYDATLPGGFDSRLITERVILHPFPRKRIATPLYIDYKGYKTIPKQGESRAIFVLRDPRDLVVSDYFSLRYSHVPIGEIPRIRQALETLSEQEGLLYVLHYLHFYGTFACQLSWFNAGNNDPEVLIVRFEDLITDNSLPIWEKIFDHFDIKIPKPVLSQLIQDYSFKSLSGRKRGSEEKCSHYRKGVHGDWKNYFDDRLAQRFKQLTRDLVVKLGYEPNNAW